MAWLGNLFRSLKTSSDSSASKSVIHLNDLKEWLGVQKYSLISQTKLEGAFVDYLDFLKSKKWEIESKLEAYKEEKASDKKDSLKPSFSELSQTLMLLNFDGEEGFEQVLEILQKFSQNLNLLLQKIPTNYPFLADLQALKVVEEQFEAKLVKTGIRQLESLQKQSTNLENSLDQIKEIKKRLASLQERLVQSQKMKTDKEAAINILKTDPYFPEIKEDVEFYSRVKDRKVEIWAELSNFFSTLKPALQEKEKELIQFFAEPLMVKNYINEPVSTLFSDDTQKIVSLLLYIKKQNERSSNNHTAKSLSVNSSSVNSHSALYSKSTILEQIKLVEAGYLEKLRREYIQLEQKSKVNYQGRSGFGLMLKMEENYYRLEHFEKQVRELESRKQQLENEIKSVEENISQGLNQIKEVVKEQLNKELEVTYSL
ncbi:hypothetical protein HYU21_00890 [Candidatus Woesearchaeota archaeon]|nr:hypothetical protein [Candidatus Woesearchaeota archaeon]